jgi:hypothetical protein
VKTSFEGINFSAKNNVSITIQISSALNTCQRLIISLCIERRREELKKDPLIDPLMLLYKLSENGIC